jgi:hypothetical protein
MRRKLSRHAKKAKLEECDNRINEKLTTPDTCNNTIDNQDDQGYNERPEIYYNPEKVSCSYME